MSVAVEGENGAVDVALVRDGDGNWHAIGEHCTHGDVSLVDGEIENGSIECWLHGSQFDLTTGAPLQLPATKSVPVYTVRIDDDFVYIDVDQKEN